MKKYNPYLLCITMEEIFERYDRNLLEGKHLFPELGSLYHSTADSRMEPSFFIIGVQKGGTSALASYLSEHPQIILPQRKDIYFFNNVLNYEKGLRWYKAHFAHKSYKRFQELKKIGRASCRERV